MQICKKCACLFQRGALDVGKIAAVHMRLDWKINDDYQAESGEGENLEYSSRRLLTISAHVVKTAIIDARLKLTSHPPR